MSLRPPAERPSPVPLADVALDVDADRVDTADWDNREEGRLAVWLPTA